MEEIEPKIIGLTGAICSGKSAVAEYLRTKDYVVLDMDAIAKELMNSDKELIVGIKKAFGETAYIQDGDAPERLNTKHIAEIAFNEPKKLAELNRLTHPKAIEATMAQLEKLVDSGMPIIFVENALLFEVGLDDAFDYIIAVSAAEHIRKARALKRGINEEDFFKRQAAQIDEKEKCACSDFVIDNSKSLEELYASVDFIVDIL